MCSISGSGVGFPSFLRFLFPGMGHTRKFLLRISWKYGLLLLGVYAGVILKIVIKKHYSHPFQLFKLHWITFFSEVTPTFLAFFVVGSVEKPIEVEHLDQILYSGFSSLLFALAERTVAALRARQGGGGWFCRRCTVFGKLDRSDNLLLHLVTICLYYVK